MGLGNENAVDEAHVETVEKLFHDNGLVPSISATPYSHPSLFSVAGKRGWSITEWGGVLVLFLEDDISVDRKIGWKGRIDAIREDELDLWAKTISHGFAADHSLSEDDTALHRSFAQMEDATCYLARMDDEIAGASIMVHLPEERMVSISSASTLPNFRGMGIHQAMIHHRLQQARELGVDTAVYMVIPGSPSQRNAERAGFQLAYSSCLIQKPAS